MLTFWTLKVGKGTKRKSEKKLKDEQEKERLSSRFGRENGSRNANI